MLGKFKPHVSPAMVVALLALIVALGGTAIAATNALSGRQKKESGRIASKVFNKRIGGSSVSHANSADTATTATKAGTATKATEATKAGTANSATTAGEATKAKTATNATLAAKATDAERLGGVAPGEYQRKLREGCPAPESISTIDQAGNVTCNTTVVKPVHRVLNTNEQFAFSLGNNLQLDVTCHDGGNTELHFQNLGGAGRLSWFFGRATNTSAAESEAVGASSEKAFSYAAGTGKIEGQFIWTIGEGVDTLDIHAIDLGATCEVGGTVISAIG